MADKAKLARDMNSLKFHFEKLLAVIKAGEELVPADQDANDLFRDTMDQIEDRWTQYDAIQSEVYSAIPVERQVEATDLLEQTDDLRSRIVRLRSEERRKRGREWQVPFPISPAEGEGKEETMDDQTGGRLALTNQAIHNKISQLIEKVQLQDTTILKQQLLAEQQRQAADLRIKTLEDLAAFRDRPAADPTRPARTHIKIPQLILSKFSNKKEEWQEFWASFEISVGDTRMGNKEKLTHLKTLLTGAAKKAIGNLQLADENYEAAVNILKKRFSCTQEI